VIYVDVKEGVFAHYDSTCECNGVVLLKSVIKLGERPSRGVCGVLRSFVGGRVLRERIESVEGIPVYIFILRSRVRCHQV
jgi:hypothetical protein